MLNIKAHEVLHCILQPSHISICVALILSMTEHNNTATDISKMKNKQLVGFRKYVFGFIYQDFPISRQDRKGNLAWLKHIQKLHFREETSQMSQIMFMNINSPFNRTHSLFITKIMKRFYCDPNDYFRLKMALEFCRWPWKRVGFIGYTFSF